MRLRDVLPVLLLGLALVGLTAMQSPAAETADATKIAKLIEQLGADSFADRQGATETLDKIGEPALEALRKATAHTDAEVRKRANDLVNKIEKRAENAKYLTPKMVHLVYKDTPLPDAVADFAKKTGYSIQLSDPEGKLKNQKVTLDTGKTTFWNAFEKFCAAAGVVEGDPNQFDGGVVPPRPGRVGRPVRAVPGRAVPARPARAVPAVPAKPVPAKDLPAKKEDSTEKKDDSNAKTKEEQAKAAAQKEAEAKKAAAVAAAQKELAKRMAVAAGAGVKIQVGGVAVPGAVPAVPLPAIAPAFPPGPGGRVYVPVQPGQIYLVPGKPAERPVDATSSVRVTVADPKKYPVNLGDKELGLVLQISPEPRLRWQQLMSVQIDKAIDNNDQKLMQVMSDNPMGGINRGGVIVFGGGAVMPAFPGRVGGQWFGPSANGLNQFTAVKFTQGEKESKLLKELTGTISAQVLSEAQKVLVVDNILKAKGKSVQAEKGEIKVNTVTKADDGTITITFELTQPEGMIPETMLTDNQLNPVVPAAPPGAVIQPNGGIQILPAVQPKPGVAPAGKPGAAGPGAAAGGAAKAVPAKAVPGKAVQVKAVPQPAIAQAVILPAGAGNVAVQIGFAPGVQGQSWYAMNGLTLQDGKGKVLRANITPNWNRGGRRVIIGGVAGGANKMEYVATYKPEKDADQPAKLVYTARKMVALNVPFTLKDVKLK